MKLIQRLIYRFVKRKQLEFVTGGWVMPDEANSHWYSVLQSLTEGQTWLKKTFNITPGIYLLLLLFILTFT